MRNALILFLAIVSYTEIDFSRELGPVNLTNEQLEVMEIASAIETLRPTMPSKNRSEMASLLYKMKNKHNIEWERYLSILFQESSLRLDPPRGGKTCKNRYNQCSDFGIGQVSYFFWGKKLQIDRKKALESLNYSISLSLIVYTHYFKKYSKRDKKWYTRYHSGTPSKRKDYEKRINAHYDKIKVAQSNFRKALLYGQKNIYQCNNWEE